MIFSEICLLEILDNNLLFFFFLKTLLPRLKDSLLLCSLQNCRNQPVN